MESIFSSNPKGCTFARAKADLEVRAHITTGARSTLRSFYEGLPADWNWHHYLGPGSAGTFTEGYKEDTEHYKVGTLIIDLFEVNNKQIVWWAESPKFISEEASEGPMHIAKTLERMFEGNQWRSTLP